MKNFYKNCALILFLAFGFILPISVLAATVPSLGGATSFGVLGSTYTNTAGTTINGDVGYTTPPAVMPTVTGATHVADSAYNQAGTDQNSALSSLNSQSCNFNYNSPTDLSLLPQPLVPGVYCVTAATSIGTGGISLSGSGTYIFRINGAFNTVANSNVSGASACNVFWTPTGAATLGANSSFAGTVIDPSGITIGSTVSWTGRALAFGGTVTTNTDAITVPVCSAPAVTTTTTTNPAPVLIAPVIGVTKTPTLVSANSTGGLIQYDYAVYNNGTVAMSNINVTDNTCSPMNYLSGDTNGNSMLETSEVWHYRCTTNVSQTTNNTVTATGFANGFTATATANATVIVNPAPAPTAPVVVVVPPPVVGPMVVPIFPRTGYAPEEKNNLWNTLIQKLYLFF